MENKNLEEKLFCSLIMGKKILSGNQIRHLIDEKKIDSIDSLYQSNEEIFTEELLSPEQYERWLEYKKSPTYDRFGEYVEYVERRNIQAVSIYDEDYPGCLKPYPNMPLILYLRGNADLLTGSKSKVSIVGTRQPSAYGRRVTREFSKSLALRDVVIVSGLARGVDGIAHQACLDAGGQTIAVMPCGLDTVYPGEHLNLFQEIEQKGLLISELMPGTKAIRQYFPARNRILSALSDCVLITEAGQNSGTLHTASFAAAQGKEVFVVPGTIYSDTSKGNLGLMKDGAQIASEPEDILAHLAGAVFFREIEEIKEEWRMHLLKEKIENHPDDLTKEEIRFVILDLLVAQGLNTDEIVRESGLPVESVSSELGKLELEGKITNENEKYILTIR